MKYQEKKCAFYQQTCLWLTVYKFSHVLEIFKCMFQSYAGETRGFYLRRSQTPDGLSLCSIATLHCSWHVVRLYCESNTVVRVCCEGKCCLCVLWTEHLYLCVMWTNTALFLYCGLTRLFACFMDYHSSLLVVWTNTALCVYCGLTQLFAYIMDYHSSLFVVWTNTALCFCYELSQLFACSME